MSQSSEAEGAERLNALISCARTLFPKPIATCVVPCHPSTSVDAEYALEAEAVEGACESRRLQYLAGRRAAREAFRQLDGPCGPLLQDASGAVGWPDGWTGSITHTKDWCVAATAHTTDCLRLGIDLEETQRMNEPIARRVLLPTELDFASTSSETFLPLAALFFSAKEALYKAVTPLVKQRLGFHDVRLMVEKTSDGLHLRAELLPSDVEGRRVVSRLVGRGGFCGPFCLAAFHLPGSRPSQQ